MSAIGRYFMDDPREPERIAEKVNGRQWVDRYLAPLLADGITVLEVGCGPGALATAAALAAPGAQVIGLDQTDRCLAEARRRAFHVRNVSFKKGDAVELPFEDGSFDVIYSRFVLEYVPEQARAVAEMARVCRLGGTVILQDLDGQILSHYPLDGRLRQDLEAILSGLARRGFDPFVGRKLYHLAHQAGLSDLVVLPEAYHLIAGAADEITQARWELKLQIAMPAIIDAVGSATATRACRELLDHLARQDTLTFSHLFTVYGSRGPAMIVNALAEVGDVRLPAHPDEDLDQQFGESFDLSLIGCYQ